VRLSGGPLAAFFLIASPLAAADYKAGTARLIVTPSTPIYLSGYASRTHASEGAVHDLWAKALAIEDRRGSRLVIVTTDLIALPRAVTDVVAARAAKEFGLERSSLLFNASHTHAGPLVGSNLELMFELNAEEKGRVSDYTAKLTDSLVAVVGASIADLAPADLWFGNGSAPFTVNRREITPRGIRIGINAEGPVDRDVPVLKVVGAGGKLRAVLFGYACHNTTLGGDFYQIAGDYAGFAQIEVEKANNGAQAMFLMLCGADQNPNPRGTLNLAARHGETLAAEVNRVLGANQARVRGPLRTAFQVVDLAFAPHTRETFEGRLTESNAWRVRHAKAMLKEYEEGRPVRRYSYPVQAAAFGKDLTILALGGEVVVDYALRAKKEFGAKGLVVAGYSNDVMSYIPSLRVLKEGGYEAVDSMTYYGLPGPYSEDVEETIFTAIRRVMRRAGAAKRGPK
jgi:hypothetical protein